MEHKEKSALKKCEEGNKLLVE